MQDYNINVNYNFSKNIRETDVKSSRSNDNKKTKVRAKNQSITRGVQKGTGLAIGVASKINSYVGALTENTIQQKNTQTVLTYAVIGVAALNPVRATVAAALYTGDKIIKYQIKKYKSDLSAGFMRNLSNGIYTTRK